MLNLRVLGVVAVLFVSITSCASKKGVCKEKGHTTKKCDHSKSVEIKEIETSSSKSN